MVVTIGLKAHKSLSLSCSYSCSLFPFCHVSVVHLKVNSQHRLINLFSIFSRFCPQKSKEIQQGSDTVCVCDQRDGWQKKSSYLVLTILNVFFDFSFIRWLQHLDFNRSKFAVKMFAQKVFAISNVKDSLWNFFKIIKTKPQIIKRICVLFSLLHFFVCFWFCINNLLTLLYFEY